ncbi:MAG TPA: hypothetical protein VFG99_08575, partial [Chloroflexia bacterium]|nr:hypothetical protein [Chloroflexia bacterium]
MALSIYITLSCAMLSLSNAASMALGAYASALLTQQAGWPLWLAVVAGLGGALYAHLRAYISPGDFGFQRAVDILVFAVVGGTFAWRGAILGAALITLLPEITRSAPVVGGLNIKDHPEIFSGLILLLVILFLPRGLLAVPLGLKLRRPARLPAEKEAAP